MSVREPLFRVSDFDEWKGTAFFQVGYDADTFDEKVEAFGLAAVKEQFLEEVWNKLVEDLNV